MNAIESITSALGWIPVAPPVQVLGQPDREALEAGRELGAVLAATIMAD